MQPAKVVLVDDSATVLRIVGRALRKRPDIELVGIARNGNEALALVDRLDPEAVVLDVEMPQLNGIETLERLRRSRPMLPIVMFSSHTEPGALATFDAIAKGASDYVLKPSGGNESLAETIELLGDKLVALVKTRRRLTALYGIGSRKRSDMPGRTVDGRPEAPFGSAPDSEGPRRRNRPFRPQLLLIGTSTGGPQALGTLLPALAHPLPVPCLVVQHMPPMFTRQMAARLDQLCPVPVREAEHGEPLRPATVLVAPGDHHLEVAVRGADLWAKITQEEPENSCRPAVDVLFRTAAGACGQNVLAVVLTGMGRDGLLGARSIVGAGGRVLSQDEASCVVWGMPRAVEEAGLSHAVVSIDEMAGAIHDQLAEIFITPESGRGNPELSG